MAPDISSSAPPSPFAFALVGAGKVGTTVATLLRDAGHRPVGVASRTGSSAAAAAARLAVPTFEPASPPPADLYLLGVPDHALVSVAQELTPALAPEAVLVHFAGSLGVAAIVTAAQGPRIAALHPVQAFASLASAGDLLPGAAWGITCSEGLERWAAGLVERDLRGHPVPVREEDRPLWHAAAVMTSNVLAAVFATGTMLLARIGVRDPARVLAPLTHGTLTNVLAAGAGAEAITGPVVRGEARTIARHLAALEERAPELRRVYVEATRTVVAAARTAGRIDEPAERALLAELGVA